MTVSKPPMLTEFERRFRKILKRIYRTLQQHEIREEVDLWSLSHFNPSNLRFSMKGSVSNGNGNNWHQLSIDYSLLCSLVQHSLRFYSISSFLLVWEEKKKNGPLVYHYRNLPPSLPVYSTSRTADVICVIRVYCYRMAITHNSWINGWHLSSVRVKGRLISIQLWRTKENSLSLSLSSLVYSILSLLFFSL